MTDLFSGMPQDAVPAPAAHAVRPPPVAPPPGPARLEAPAPAALPMVPDLSVVVPV
jgi:hypothetical protein